MRISDAPFSAALAACDIYVTNAGGFGKTGGTFFANGGSSTEWSFGSVGYLRVFKEAT